MKFFDMRSGGYFEATPNNIGSFVSNVNHFVLKYGYADLYEILSIVGISGSFLTYLKHYQQDWLDYETFTVNTLIDVEMFTAVVEETGEVACQFIWKCGDDIWLNEGLVE